MVEQNQAPPPGLLTRVRDGVGTYEIEDVMRSSAFRIRYFFLRIRIRPKNQKRIRIRIRIRILVNQLQIA